MTMNNNFFNTERKVFALIFIIYFLSSLIQFNFNSELRIDSVGLHLPRALTGDEPHYLIAINSFMKDFDFDVKNNYDSVAINQSLEGGVNFRNNLNGALNERRNRYVLNKTILDRQIRDPLTTRIKPEFLEFIKLNEKNMSFITTIPPGLPVLFGLFLFPLRNTQYVEFTIILTTMLLSVLGLSFFYKTLLHFSENKKRSLFFTFLYAFATPLWFYSKTIYTEPYATALLTMMFYFVVVRKNTLLAGFIGGLMFVIKYPFLIFSVPFAAYILFYKKRKISSLLKFSSGYCLFIFAQMAYNYTLFGNIFETGRTDAIVNTLEGLFGILFSPSYGLLFFSPILIFCIFGFKGFFKAHKKELFLILGITLPFYLLMASFSWEGGSYSNRYILPIIFTLIIPLQFWYNSTKNLLAKNAFNLLIYLSAFVNVQAALFSALAMGKTPWIAVHYLLKIFHLG